MLDRPIALCRSDQLGWLRSGADSFRFSLGDLSMFHGSGSARAEAYRGYTGAAVPEYNE